MHCRRPEPKPILPGGDPIALPFLITAIAPPPLVRWICANLVISSCTSPSSAALRRRRPSQVRQLEVELKQALLYRNGRGVTPTEAGKRLLGHARGILMQVDRARWASGNAGRVDIGFVYNAARGPAVARYPLIIPSHPNANRMRIETLLADRGLKPRIAYEIDAIASILLAKLSESSRGGVSLDGFDRNVGRLPHRKKYRKARSATRFAFDFDTSAVLPHDRVRHRETEPRPLPDRLGREKRLEDPIQVVGRDTAPGIGKADPRFRS
jgi:hypothetical protein